MNSIALLRLFRILRIFTRYRLDQLLLAFPLPWFARLLLRLGPWRLRPAPRNLSRGLRGSGAGVRQVRADTVHAPGSAGR